MIGETNEIPPDLEPLIVYEVLGVSPFDQAQVPVSYRNLAVAYWVSKLKAQDLMMKRNRTPF